MSNNTLDSEKIILTGRIYPAIQNCVGNRYKIIIGYIAIVGFLLVNVEILNRFIESDAVFFLTVVFTLFVFHNTANYWLNAIDQWKLEGAKKKKIPIVEVLSAILMIILIWGGYIILINFSRTA